MGLIDYNEGQSVQYKDKVALKRLVCFMSYQPFVYSNLDGFKFNTSNSIWYQLFVGKQYNDFK